MLVFHTQGHPNHGRRAAVTEVTCNGSNDRWAEAQVKRCTCVHADYIQQAGHHPGTRRHGSCHFQPVCHPSLSHHIPEHGTSCKDTLHTFIIEEGKLVNKSWRDDTAGLSLEYRLSQSATATRPTLAKPAPGTTQGYVKEELRMTRHTHD